MRLLSKSFGTWSATATVISSSPVPAGATPPDLERPNDKLSAARSSTFRETATTGTTVHRGGPRDVLCRGFFTFTR